MYTSAARRARTPLALAVGLALGIGSAHAATITVTDSGDSGSSATCTLRQAIESANTDGVVGACGAGAGADSVEFDSSLANSTITLADTALAVAENTTLTINGSGQTIDANDASRVIYVDDLARLTASRLTITGGNTSNSGGGIYVIAGATLSLSDSMVSGNSSGGDGGGIYVFGGSLAISDSTIRSNNSDNSANGHGGGVLANFYSAVTIVNSTISGNSAGYGGGVETRAGTTLFIGNSTISSNHATHSGGGIFADVYTVDVVDLSNTILSGNTAPVAPDLAGGIQMAADFSLLGTALEASYSGNGNVFSDAPGLGLLANNGGSTMTMLPQLGSPAIDVGNNSLIPAGVTSDQRGAGFARIVNGTVDIGAVEWNDIIFANGFDGSGAP